MLEVKSIFMIGLYSWLFNQLSQSFFDSLVNSSLDIYPTEYAKSSAPSPASITWGVFSITSLANLATWTIFSTAITDPQSPRWFITHASRVTIPVLSGEPPRPTVVFFGLDSSMATPSTAASKEFEPLSNSWPALRFASEVFQVETDLTIPVFFINLILFFIIEITPKPKISNTYILLFIRTLF